VINTRIKAPESAAATNSADAIHFRVHYVDAQRKEDYAQWTPPPPPADWTTVHWRLRVPDNVSKATLEMGLTGANAGVWVEPADITDGS